jgi:serine/threonine protein phosphatase PrpC
VEWFIWAGSVVIFSVVGFFVGALKSKKIPSNTQSDPTGEKAPTLVQAPVGRIPRSPSKSAMPDVALTIFSLEVLGLDGHEAPTVSAASIRGTSHIESGLSRQDNFCLFTTPTETVIVISDGVSSADEAQAGSLFIVQNFERLYDEVFPSGANLDLKSWKLLNKKVSQNLVAMHVARSKQRGVQVPEETSSLRISASEKYAATLEILICANTFEGKNMPYTYVRLAGDGSLFEVGTELQIPQESSNVLSLKRSSVNAIPTYDGDPEMYQGELAPGSAVVVCTDGVGDYLPSNSSWEECLIEFSQLSKPSAANLLSLISFHDSNSRDDRTIAIVSNPK